MAVSDPLEIIATPLGVIDRKKTPAYFSEIDSILKDLDIKQIIVGIPLSMSGFDSEQTTIVRDFIDQLQGRVNIPVKSVDERLSSRAAKSTLIQLGIKTGRHKEEIDKAAASVILQEFLDSH